DDRSDESSIEISRLGGGPVIGFPLSENSEISLRYEFIREDISVDDTASVVLQGDEGARLTSRVGYTVDYDKRNDPLEPTEGYLLTASQDFAGLGGDARYVRTVASAKGWTSFFGDEIIASLEFEAAGIAGFGDDIRFNERFFLGGNNLRGFADEGAGPRDLATNDSLGGNYRLRSRLQASFPLGLPDDFGIFGGAFVDAGTLFDLDNNDGGRIDDSSNLRVSAGGLLFVATPFGPLELSFGFPLIQEDEDETELFRLSIGTRF
ncbi:MAG: BamA/TamA family outer membrane protein, partial [Pseudomonadota bacterium]